MQVQARCVGRPAVQVQLVEGDGADAVDLRQGVEQAAVAQQQTGVAVAEHVGQALGRVVDVQRHIGTPGLENGQQADQQLRRALDRDGHAGVGADAFVAQVVGQAVGLLVQFGVVEAAALPHQRGALRGLARLLVELFDQQALGCRCRCLSPGKQLRTALRIKQLHLAQGQPRVGADLLQQRQQVMGQAFDGGGLEQLGGVVEGQAQTAQMIFFAVQLQVELGFAAVPRQLFGEQARQAAQGREVALLMVEHDLEQALVTGLGQCFEQLFERQVLVGLGVEGGLAHLGQQLREGQAAIELRAQHLAVDEEADQALGFQARAVGVGHADTDVGLPAVAVQQALPAGQEHHEQAGLLVAGQALEGFAELGRDLQVETGGALVTLTGARMVGAQVEHRQCVTQPGFPVVQLALGFTVGQPLPLPAAVVGVAQWQRREVGLMALAMGGIQLGELVEQDVQRPAVGDDVVQGHPQLMVFIVQARQGHTQQWPLGQVEWLLGFCFAACSDLGRRLALQVQALQAERLRRQDALQRLPSVLAEQRAQGFVAHDQGLERGFQRRLVQLATQVQTGWNVVRRRLRRQLPEQPQAVLCQRLGQGLGTAEGRDGGGCSTPFGEDCGHGGAVVGQHRGFEQRAQAHVDSQLIGQPRGGLSGGDGVAAQQQEVVVRRDRFDLEHFAPDGGDACLQVIADGGGLLHCSLLGEACVAVEAAIVHAQAAGRALQLAAGGLGQRTRVEQQHHGRRLAAGLGDDLAQGLDQVLRLEGLLHVAADFYRDADALLALVVDGEHRHAAFAQHLDLTLQGLFQILRVKVLAAHDEHVFQAPGNEHLTVAHEAQVAGTQPGLAVHGDEGLGAGLGVAPVTLGDARAASPDLADLVIRQHCLALWLDDTHRVPGLRITAAHQDAAPARFGAVGGEGLGIQLQRRDALPPAATADEQRGFGQAVAGEEVARVEAARLELLGEGIEAVLADRFGA
ncbi:hypothetical protein D3C79_553780 [compost metagenome]